MIHDLTTAMTRHVALLRKQRAAMEEMFMASLADMDAAIADADDMIGGPRAPEAETAGEQEVQYQQAAE